jgi:hypothetical protein
MKVKTALGCLEDRWDDSTARGWDEVELLRYRSNLLGSDLRITNFGGGHTELRPAAQIPRKWLPGEAHSGTARTKY